MAFAPDYARSGKFYIYYTDRGGNIRVQELRRSSNPDRADLASRRQVLFQDHSSFPNHNGGQLQFGPDGDLYIGLGDGGSEGDPLGNGQNLGTWLGKILRIDPNAAGGRAYSIPSGNPFTSQRGDRPEIYAYGLRNPWRFSFDKVTGDLAIGDVGQDKYEEIDFEGKGKAAGLNFGWKGYEGFRRYSSVPIRGAYAPPVLVRSHKAGFCAIVGGYVVRDRSLPGLYGRYLYGDNCNKGIYSVKLRPGHASRRPDAAHTPDRPQLVRRGRPRAHLRRLARGSRLPARCLKARVRGLDAGGAGPLHVLVDALEQRIGRLRIAVLIQQALLVVGRA